MRLGFLVFYFHPCQAVAVVFSLSLSGGEASAGSISSPKVRFLIRILILDAFLLLMMYVLVHLVALVGSDLII